MQIEQGERDLTITEAEKLASIFGIPLKILGSPIQLSKIHHIGII